MRLLAKFNLVFITVFTLGLIAAGMVSNWLLQRNARSEVVRQARFMMESALAARNYTTKHVKPVLNDDLKYHFYPQTVPAFAASESMKYLQKRYPEFRYKEAVLNPTNPNDLAKGWEATVVKKFRQQAKLKEQIGIRNTKNGQSLYLARPIKITDRSCLACHSTPAKAPPTMIKKYGSKRGFGWKHNEIVGAQLVSVPMSLPLNLANQAFKTMLAMLFGVFALTLIALNIMLRFLVIRPVTRLSQQADAISTGRDVGDLPVNGQDEISELTGSFNRMQRSLSQAMKMLDD
jgi:protein-histidine pros-kinase